MGISGDQRNDSLLTTKITLDDRINHSGGTRSLLSSKQLPKPQSQDPSVVPSPNVTRLPSVKSVSDRYGPLAQSNNIVSQRHNHILMAWHVTEFVSFFVIVLLSCREDQLGVNETKTLAPDMRKQWGAGTYVQPDSMNGTRIKQSGNQSICRGCSKRQKKCVFG